MAGSLRGPTLKLDRANIQAAALTGEIVTFCNRNPYRLVQQRHVDLDENRAVVFGIVKTPHTIPEHWGLVIGEIVHNLRSALDHLAWQLIIRATCRPPIGNKKAGFPIFLTQEGYDSPDGERLRIPNVDADMRQIIRSYQPFMTGQGTANHLWVLHELNNIDKHQDIVLTGAVLDPKTAINVEFRAPGRVGFQRNSKESVLKDGVPMVRLVLEPSTLPILERLEQVTMTDKFTPYIAFDEPAFLRACNVLLVLRDIGKTVGKIFNEIHDIF